MMTAAYIVFAFAIGALVGCFGPSFIQLWKISQMSYGMGYKARGHVVGVHVKRAQRFLACTHFPLPADGPVCRKCATRARASLDDVLKVDGETPGA